MNALRGLAERRDGDDASRPDPVSFANDGQEERDRERGTAIRRRRLTHG